MIWWWSKIVKSLKEDDARFLNIPLDQFCGSTQFLHQFEYILDKVEENILQFVGNLKTSLREWLVGPMDDGVVGTEVDALQDVLLRSLVLHIVLIPDHDDHDDDEYFILSTEVYLRVVVYVAPNLNICSNVVSLKKIQLHQQQQKLLKRMFFILISYQKLAALMVQRVATERENCHHDKRDDDNDNVSDDNRGMKMMTMKEVRWWKERW